LNAVVSIVKTQDFTPEKIREAVFEAIDKIKFKPAKPIRSALLKVNLRYYWDYTTGETTDPRIVSAVIDYLRQRFDPIEITVAEADASAMRTKHAFKILGYERLAAEKKVRLMNLCEGDKVYKNVEVNHHKFDLPVPKALYETDMLINIPKLRTHRLVTISCSLKNLFGAIGVPRKVVYHPHLDEVIVAINKLVKPQLTLVDGVIALGAYPAKMGLIMASEDQLAIDFIAAKVMGYNPNRIRHLKLAEKESIGTGKEIQIVGEKEIKALSKLFPRENYFIFNMKWNLELRVLDAYLKITRDTRPPVLDR
jgi:uncharacterized protein (DUF362 family)